MRIYFVDVEGGQATLFVMPNGTSLLVDTGNPTPDSRDAKRIASAAKQAGLSKIDYVLLTHYHADHTGGVPQLLDQIPVGAFLDHGDNSQHDQGTQPFYDAYQKVLATGKYKHYTMKPGDKLPIPGMDATVLSSNAQVIDHPLPHAGQANPLCGQPDNMPSDIDLVGDMENNHSLGFLLNFGKISIVDLGDLTWENERKLMCPVNKVGHPTIWIVSHHGTEPSSSPVLVEGLAPQVAIMDNGEFKGGIPRVLDGIRNSPAKPDLWELHYAAMSGEKNVDPSHIANLLSSWGEGMMKARAAGKAPVGGPPAGGQWTPPPNDEGYMITVTAYPSGKYTVTNGRTGTSQSYQAK